jgi:hypothetical protein
MQLLHYKICLRRTLAIHLLEFCDMC